MAAKTVSLDNTLDNKVTVAEAMWLFKVAEKDLSLRDCNHTPQLFQNMFPDSEISLKFSMSKDKVSYVFQDGLRPLLREKICQAVQKSEGAFTLMFDEMTAAHKLKSKWTCF